MKKSYYYPPEVLKIVNNIIREVFFVYLPV